MSEHRGNFCWYELMTDDIAGAAGFYRRVIGWTEADSGMTDRTYHMFSQDGVAVAGLMPIPERARAQGARPHWRGYIYSDDVDADAARAAAAGGQVHLAPTDIPGVGRFAGVADPAGAMFYLFNDSSGTQHPPLVPGTPGQFGWHELLAGDPDAMLAFYGALFGWTRSDAIPMGELGVYQLFAIRGVAVGGMMAKPPQMPQPSWRFYVNVPAIDAAAARVAEAGGSVLSGPHQVPGGSWILHGRDGQGATFALTAPRR